MVPAGPMPSGLSNVEKTAVRTEHAAGRVGRDALMDAEQRSYHAPGTCTFYGTANSNQILVEALGVQLPGASFVEPSSPLRAALNAEASARAVALAGADDLEACLGAIVSEKALVNAIVALLATGGSTNHTMHLVAIAAAAGIAVTWDDFAALSSVVPLLARIYPNGSADINEFHVAGGTSFLFRELLSAGLLHEDVPTVAGHGMARYADAPGLDDTGRLHQVPAPVQSRDGRVLAGVARPFSADGGLRIVNGSLGRAVVRVSSVARDRLPVVARARVFDDQPSFLAAFEAGDFDEDVVVVVRHQGPRANGMPELHKLTPALSVLQQRGLRVALVTDGRMSGASGTVPAAIHCTPEAALGGPLARLRDGDLVRVDPLAGVLDVETQDDFTARDASEHRSAVTGTGRELFASFRAVVGGAEEGASIFWPRACAPVVAGGSA
jgi:phosphogluconate dehydratase